MDEDERFTIPEAIEPPEEPEEPRFSPHALEEPEEPEEEGAVEDLSDLTTATREDIMGKRDGNSEDDDLSDLTEFSEADQDELLEVDHRTDVMGNEPKPKPRYRLVRRPPRIFREPPPSSLGGVRE